MLWCRLVDQSRRSLRSLFKSRQTVTKTGKNKTEEKLFSHEIDLRRTRLFIYTDVPIIARKNSAGVKETNFVIRPHFRFSFTAGELNNFLFASDRGQKFN